MEKRSSILRSLVFVFRNRNRCESEKAASLKPLSRIISYRFQDIELLKQALTHRSYMHESSEGICSNERLEFLGDAVLGLIVTEELYRRYPERSEGDLTKLKTVLVNGEMLAKQAEKIGLGRFMFLGSGEEGSGGRARPSLLSDAFEALLGAIYLDGDLSECRRFLSRFLFQDMDHVLDQSLFKNYKSRLLEHVQGMGMDKPEYRILKETGPDHKKEFTVEVRIQGRLMGKGRGFSKKRAEQAAARQAIESLGLAGSNDS